jgi:hypothetical protein
MFDPLGFVLYSFGHAVRRSWETRLMIKGRTSHTYVGISQSLGSDEDVNDAKMKRCHGNPHVELQYTVRIFYFHKSGTPDYHGSWLEISKAYQRVMDFSLSTDYGGKGGGGLIDDLRLSCL